MLVLAIETSTPIGSVALVHNGRVLCEVIDTQPTHHNEGLILKIQQVLEKSGAKKNDVDLLAVDQGPGAFTGLRIGMAAAQGIAVGLQKPWIGICSLEAMALAAHKKIGKEAFFFPVLNAYKGEIFGALYTFSGIETVPKTLMAPACDTAASLCSHMKAVIGATDGEVCFFGNGVSPYREAFMLQLSSELSRELCDESLAVPTASSIGLIAYACHHHHSRSRPIEPSYLRDSDARPQRKTPP